MTMQVSKGEFDRRVKLLEQKVRDSSNGLISRLQAETEAFIEKLRNTELNIENLENEVAGTEANLDNLVTSFNNYKANTLRVNDVFDANGQFDGSKIKPLSIDTAAISVGQRSQQLTLTGVNFTVNDYSSGNGKLIWTGGTMFHYGFEAEDGKPKLYTIYVQNNTGEYSFQNGNAHYIYAVFKRDTKTETTYNNIGTISKDYFDNCDSGVLFLDSAGTTPATTYNSATTYYLKQTETISNAISGDNTAYILVTTSKISVDGNIIDGQGTFNPTNIPGANYSANQKLFYIQLGYVSGTLPGSNGYNYRKVDMTYGSTTINGRLITTGRIEGNGAWFDLDQGKIGGNIEFNADWNSSIAALGYATQTDISNIEIGGRNLHKDSEKLGSSWVKENATVSNGEATITKGTAVARIYQSPASGYWSWESDTEYVASIEAKAEVSGQKLAISPYGAGADVKVIELTTAWKRYSYSFKSGTSVSEASMTYAANDNNSTIYVRKPKLEKGSLATDWTPAPEDMEEGGWVTNTRTLYYVTSTQTKPSVPTSYNNKGNWKDDAETLSNYISTYSSDPTIITDYSQIYTCIESYKEKNSVIKDYKCTSATLDEAMTTNLFALRQTTTISGGLVLTTKILCGSGSDTAGMMGVPSSTFAFWAGNQDPSQAPIWIKRNGDARFQNLYFTNSVITNKSTLANSEFGIHTDYLSSALNINFQKYFSSSGKTLEMQPTSIQWILKLEEFGSYTWDQVNSGYLRVGISFDYEMTLSNVGSTGNVTFYFYDGVEKQGIGSASFTVGQSKTVLDSITSNNLMMTHMSNSNYYYGLIGIIEPTGGSSTPFGGLSMRINNVKISLYSSMPNMNKGFHIHPNGIVLYVNESHYFMLFDNGSELKCYNTLGI